VQPDGKVLLAGYGQHDSVDMEIGYVARYNADSSIDGSYATVGVRRFGDSTNGKRVRAMSLGAEGKAMLAGDLVHGVYPNSTYGSWVTQLNADGSVDSGFGNQGELLPACTPPRTQCYIQGLARQADGKIVALNGAYDLPYGNQTAFLDRYEKDGALDATFGNGGRVLLPQDLGAFESYHLAIDKEGRYVVSGYIDHGNATANEGVLLRLTAAGAMDASFGNGGVVRMALSSLKTDFRRFDFQADGRIVIVSTTYDPKLKGARYFAHVLRFNTDGAQDMSFGSAGVAEIGAGYGNGVAVQADGAIVYYGDGHVDATSTDPAMTTRLTPDGKPDTAFGVVLPYKDGNIAALTDVAIGADNRLTYAGYSDHLGAAYEHSMVVRLIGTETTTNVVEFYNTTLNHYFITADPNEASAIDNGAAGPGWSRTGSVWKSGGPARVCRFYGSPDVDAATGKRKGPNGHFYTISADECALVREDAGWKFESYDFSGWPKQADGSCAAGTIAVKRAYNNRFAVNDSNHRYTTSDAIYNQMMASGWSGEGTVFCAPQ